MFGSKKEEVSGQFWILYEGESKSFQTKSITK
jgi:hypothetical protein